MSQAKKRPPIMKSKQKEQINKKALVWIGSIFAVIVVIMAVLLIIDN
ncbi:putative membrane protein YvbJ [Paenibacillus sacheonensis]|nr:putative membrane protein YvbJ [Paenibacillus sacheonensis]